MTLTIDDKPSHVDRSGIRTIHPNGSEGNQGFNIWFGDFNIHFEDERDALAMARMIAERLGHRVD